MQTKTINMVTISSLFPNSNDPKHGIFVKTRLKHYLASYPGVKAVVIAPIPWFPFKHKMFGEYAKYAGVPECEVIDGITVFHPRYLVVPKIGMYLTPETMQWAIKRTLRKLIKNQSVDVIDGHYFYPDGVAICQVAEEFNIPFTCTARGTDINLVPQYPKAREMLKPVFAKAAHMMTVCAALKDEMLSLGVADERITVLRNGVDLTLFECADDTQQLKQKQAHQINGQLILSVGWLIERKGHYLIIEALKQLPDVHLVVAGDGPDWQKLQSLAKSCQVEERVTFIGAVDQKTLNQWMMAADALVLASSREGWANVLLESMASGTPVVATKVWGTPEVVQPASQGVLVERTVDDIARGIRHLLSSHIDRKAVRQYAEQFSWRDTCTGMHKIFSEIVDASHRDERKQ
ncbi:glycosyltransferase family 4 protein [Alteromonas gilva]|uniref:Glycosyltransferase family 4 protein n=1 Tax=Alteromonas gilva TaxID=2987522 RepID=A0ABT5L1Q5_9ALTE|nr:glycosyltransferase family 4 protein [Alteromonas gilva]MDC8830331.1 glycosyltransferase family 4 protein [Alteromonas gilva]